MNERSATSTSSIAHSSTPASTADRSFTLRAKEALNLEMFEGAKSVSFTFMKQHIYTGEETRTLKVFPFVTDQVMCQPAAESSDYWYGSNQHRYWT